MSPAGPTAARTTKKIFVLGTGRSGTHFLARALLAHPDIEGVAEPPRILALATRLALFPEVRAAEFPRLAAWYEAEHAKVAPRHYLDKCHPNLWVAERLAERFRGARFVGILRGVEATVASMLDHSGVLQWIRRWREFPLPCSFLGIPADGADRYAKLDLPARCALRWRAHRDELAWLARALPDRFLHVDYEDLVRDPDAGFARLQEFLGLSESIPRPEVEAGRLDAWRTRLDDRQLASIASVLRD